MAVLVKLECQNCETVKEVELNGALVIGYMEINGESGIEFWTHELDNNQILELFSIVINSISKNH